MSETQKITQQDDPNYLLEKILKRPELLEVNDLNWKNPFSVVEELFPTTSSQTPPLRSFPPKDVGLPI